MSNYSVATTTSPRTLEERSWIDENTGRRVWQLTNDPNGAAIGYFRYPRHLPNGHVLVHERGRRGGGLAMLDPETGEVQSLGIPGRYLNLRISDGQMWFLKRPPGLEIPTDRKQWRLGPRDLYTVNLPEGEPQLLAHLPEEIAQHVSDITCDGSTLVLEERYGERVESPVGSSDIEKMWAHFTRPRSGAMFTYDIASGTRNKIVETQDVSTFHVDTSPVDPTLIRFAHDMLECTGQRMFTVRTDGSDLRPIRVQELGEMITHEFWWPDSNSIGYTYQDRRGDTTIRDIPWCEYASITSHLGIANLQGEEVYLSDPLNSYHSHIYVSRCGTMVSGEGTHNNSFVFAAPFSWDSNKIDFQALATIHTDYHPMSGQGVDADFSADGKWMLYNDTIGGKMQVCRVQIDL